ncbi:hypothetical protein RHS01_05126 [Rhizoctonia solani]|uniref:Uncharacterized protein n=1 Tax=Rhizoctonia solani TaxID=456999 RepID=A0A8H7IDB9_9AGAM|nr:hypothetical protein RHS01_05126 [Rhizoctonia solani]
MYLANSCGLCLKTTTSQCECDISAPPRSIPQMKRFFSPRLGLPMHSAPRTRPPSRSPPKPIRAPPPAPRPVSPVILITRPVSPSSSASSSDTEPPRTPPAASAPLPAYVLAPPPPAEWESAIDALFEFDDEEEEVVAQTSYPYHHPPYRLVSLLFPSQLSSPINFTHSPSSPLPPSMSVYASDSLPMSPTFSRPLGSPGLMPTSPLHLSRLAGPCPLGLPAHHGEWVPFLFASTHSFLSSLLSLELGHIHTLAGHYLH